MSWLSQAKALYVKGRNSVLYYPIENKVYQITSNQHCDDADKLRKDIVDATYTTIEQWTLISKAIWERLNDAEGWRHAYKALLLMEHLAVFGARRAYDEFTQPDAIDELRPLLNFEYISPVDMRDHGKLVRDTAQRVMDLLTDHDRIEQLRQQAKDHEISGFDPLEGTVIKTGIKRSESPKRKSSRTGEVRETIFSPASPTFEEDEKQPEQHKVRRTYFKNNSPKEGDDDEVQQLRQELEQAYQQLDEKEQEMKEMQNHYETQLQRVTAERDHYQRILANYNE
jgi:hypothetical protein